MLGWDRVVVVGIVLGAAFIRSASAQEDGGYGDLLSPEPPKEEEKKDKCLWWDRPSTVSGGLFLVPVGRVRGFWVDSPRGSRSLYDTSILEVSLRSWLLPWLFGSLDTRSDDVDTAPTDIPSYSLLGIEASAGLLAAITGEAAAESGYFVRGELSFRLGTDCWSRVQLAVGGEGTFYAPGPPEAPGHIYELYGALRAAPLETLRLSLEVRSMETTTFYVDDGPYSDSLASLLVGGELDLRFLERSSYGVHFVASYARSIPAQGAPDVQRWLFAARYRQEVSATGTGFLSLLNIADSESRSPDSLRFHLAFLAVEDRILRRARDGVEAEHSFLQLLPVAGLDFWFFEEVAVSLSAAVDVQTQLVTVEPSVIYRRPKNSALSAWWLRAGDSWAVHRPAVELASGSSRLVNTEHEPFLQLWVRPLRFLEAGLAAHFVFLNLLEFEENAPTYTREYGLLLGPMVRLVVSPSESEHSLVLVGGFLPALTTLEGEGYGFRRLSVGIGYRYDG